MNNCYDIKNLQVFYHGKPVLDIPKLLLARGRSVAVLGQNGAGKTTLLNHLALLEEPQRGVIKLFDEQVSSSPTPAQRRRIGLVAQQPFLLPGSVSDNILLALRLQRVDKRLHRQLLTDVLQLLHLTDLADQQATSLSGGELKRVAIARVLAYQPDVLLLDEPFSHLDTQHLRQLEDLIGTLSRDLQRTVIFTTHNRVQAHALADDTIHLMRGKVTRTPLLNLFHGHFDGRQFHTRHLHFHASSEQTQARHIAIDPREITISTQAHFDSSARNQLQGRLIQISEDGPYIRLSVDCGETFEVIISAESLLELGLALGDNLWLSFKATAVTLL